MKDKLNSTPLYVKEIRISSDELTKAIEDHQEDAYLLDIPAIKQLMKEPLELNSKVTFIVGENGSGKSTLIEAIASAVGFNPEGGDIHTLFKTHSTHSILSNYTTIVRNGSKNKDGYFLRAESFYNVASYLDDAGSFDDPRRNRFGENLHKESHGESFLSLIRNRLEGKGLYIFDEPEAALSPSRIMTLMCIMHELEKDDSQFIISTHSPILMSYPNAEIFELNEEGIRKINYKDSEHYQITRDFIEKPEIMFKHLFNEK